MIAVSTALIVLLCSQSPTAPASKPGPAKDSSTTIQPAPAAKPATPVKQEKPAASAEEAPGLKVGDVAPDCMLKNAEGKPVRLADMHREKPLVVLFYRGGWCPFCTKQLAEWEGRLAEVKAAGAALVAITLEKPEHAQAVTEKHKLSYTVLVDDRQQAVRGFRLGFLLDTKTQEKYKGFGVDLPARNMGETWELPVTGTYLIGTDGKVAFAYNDPDYRKRVDPDLVIAAARKLTKP